MWWAVVVYMGVAMVLLPSGSRCRQLNRHVSRAAPDFRLGLAGDAGEWMGNIDGRLACEPVPKAESQADDPAEGKPEAGEEGLGGSSTEHGDDAADVPAPDPAAAAEGHGQKDEL